MRHEIKKIVDENGKEILLERTKFMTIFTKNNPQMEKEKKALALSLNERVTELLVNCKEDEKKDKLIEAKKRLNNVSNLSEKAANAVLISLIYALGWDKSYVNVIMQNDESSESEKEVLNTKNDQKTENSNTLKLKEKSSLLSWLVGIVIVVGIVFGISQFIKPNYKSLIKKYYEACENNDIKKIASCYPKEYKDIINKRYQNIKGFITLFAGGKVKYEYKSETKLTESEIEKLEEGIKETYDADLDIKECYKIDLETNIYVSKNQSFYIGKVGIKWYILHTEMP